MGDAPVERTSAWQKPRLTFRRLFGLDRSGPPPPMTLAGAPLNPWTIPNAIGFVRLALIPVFFVVAMSSERRHGRLAGDPVRRHRLDGLRGRHRRARHRPVLAARAR